MSSIAELITMFPYFTKQSAIMTIEFSICVRKISILFFKIIIWVHVKIMLIDGIWTKFETNKFRQFGSENALFCFHKWNFHDKSANLNRKMNWQIEFTDNLLAVWQIDTRKPSNSKYSKRKILRTWMRWKVAEKRCSC